MRGEKEFFNEINRLSSACKTDEVMDGESGVKSSCSEKSQTEEKYAYAFIYLIHKSDKSTQ